MRAIDIIRRKRDGLELSSGEIQTFVAAAARGQWPDYQLSALLMAICCRGMTAEETATLTRCMADSGTRVDLSDLAGVKVDKHSTGGVGDKTSLILAPLAAACGVIVPMMSGRGLGHTGGTLDKLEAIPGYRVQLTLAEFRQVLEAVGMAMIGQTADLAPADRKLYALRDATATVESIPLITASILSKKLAEGISGLVIDVKCGSGAFMKTVEDARQLARSLIRVGTANGLTIEALITAMDSPLGEAVGNSVEVIEAIEVLKGRGPRDVSDLSIRLAAIMVRLAGLAGDNHQAEQKVRAALDSGAGLERFRRSIAAQGGDPRVIEDYSRLPLAPHRHAIFAPRPGTVSEVRAETIGIGATVLGAGRERAEDAVDPGVAIQVRVRPGQRVQYGETLLELHYHSEQRLQAALPLLESAVRIGDAPPPPQPLILEMLS